MEHGWWLGAENCRADLGLAGEAAFMECWGLVTQPALVQVRAQAMPLLADVSWCSLVLRFDRCLLAMSGDEMLHSLARANCPEASRRPYAWIVSPANLTDYERAACGAASLGYMRRAFTDFAQGQSWAAERGKAYRGERLRRGTPATGRASSGRLSPTP